MEATTAAGSGVIEEGRGSKKGGGRKACTLSLSPLERNAAKPKIYGQVSFLGEARELTSPRSLGLPAFRNFLSGRRRGHLYWSTQPTQCCCNGEKTFISHFPLLVGEGGGRVRIVYKSCLRWEGQ